VESATVDGAGELRIFFQMIIPLSKPALATVGLLQLLNFWNSWFNAMLYINRNKDLYPLQYLLQVMLRNIQEILKDMMNNVGVTSALDLPMENTRMAMCMLAAGPMLLVFPFFQKYFTKGLTVGSVKG
jgi:putative aldouronate transport system permease protein